MSYVTAIEDLPFVEQLETGYGGGFAQGGGGFARPGEEKLQKFIRPSSQMMPASGMEPYGRREGYGPPHPGGVHATMQQNFREGYEMAEQQPVMQVMAPQVPDVMTFNCIDIARHVQDCPICSKFYNNDRTVYIIVIIILAIVCLLLLKRVLNV